jgi:hypothetical protein
MSERDFLTPDNIGIVCGLIGAIASIVALVQATRALFKSERRKAFIDIAIFIVLSTVSVGGFYYYWSARPVAEDLRLKGRMTGLLKAAHSELISSMLNLQISLPMEEADFASPAPPGLPRTLDKLISDGEVFALLSPGLQSELPRFTGSLEALTEGYKQGYGIDKHGQPGTLLLMWLNCYIQNVFINLELLFQTNQLLATELSWRQDAARSYEAMLLILRTKGPQASEVDG